MRILPLFTNMCTIGAKLLNITRGDLFGNKGIRGTRNIKDVAAAASEAGKVM